MLFRIIALTLVALTFSPVLSWACDPGYCVTSTVPANQAGDVPVDSKIFVFFTSTPGFTEPQAGLLLVETDTQQGILSSIEVFNGPNPGAEVGNYAVVLEPLLPLAPNTEYELGFGEGSVCGAPTLKFTTGDQNALSPVFAGATSGAATCITAPAELTSCDDNSVFPRANFTFEVPVPENAAGLLVYRVGAAAAPAILPGPTARLEVLPADLDAAESCFVVRAIGLSGMQVGDSEVCVPTAGVCAVEPGEEMGNPTSDMGVLVDDMGASESDTGVDMDLGDVVSSTENLGLGDAEGGCGCATSSGVDGSWLLFLFGFMGRRRRAKSGSQG